jgi:predicted secreted protein
MAKNDKKQYKLLTDEDIQIIKSDPAGLADYVVGNKVKSARKSAIIFTLVAVALAFAGGVLAGMAWTKSSIPNNVVQIQVGNTSEPTVENTEGK